MESTTQQNAALVEEASASAEQLGQLADDLIRAVSVFQLDRAQIAASDTHVVAPRPNAPAAQPDVAPARGASNQFVRPQDKDEEWEEF